MYQYNIVYTKT